MKTVIVTKDLDGKKIDRAIRALFKKLPEGMLYKALRKKDVKANGKRIREDYIVSDGDVLEIYISDEIIDGTGSKAETFSFSVIYENDDLFIVNKDQGISVEADSNGEQSLIDQVKEYFAQRNCSIEPMLCHRLDRNTGGLVILAKNEKAFEYISMLLKQRLIRKFYVCLVKGKVVPKNATLKAYLYKDATNSLVKIADKPSRNFAQIITKYKVLEYLKLDNDQSEDITRLEVELITGKTHQIRAHLAHIGHPIIGDGKYGINAFNKKAGMKRQFLFAVRIEFPDGLVVAI